jgi:class 3 adenylate cyclase
MAVFQRANGNTGGVFNIGAGRHTANATIINVGIAPPITAYKIGTFGSTANLAAELQGVSGAGVPGAVETLLSLISQQATVLAYQVDAAGSSAQLSVITERSGWTDAFLQANIQALATNIGAYSAIVTTSATASSTGGIKLA